MSASMLSAGSPSPGSKTGRGQARPIRSSYLPMGWALAQLGPGRPDSPLFRKYWWGSPVLSCRALPLLALLEGQGVASVLVAIWPSQGEKRELRQRVSKT